MRFQKRFTATAAAIMIASLFAENWANTVSADINNLHPEFRKLWNRTDALVASGQANRAWSWGPTPIFTTTETYLDAVGGMGLRSVVYFDKGRMEINNINANQNDPFSVTSGLLAQELIGGQIQIGNKRFVESYPANIPIAGDLDDVEAPTYASFFLVANTDRFTRPQPQRYQQLVTQTIDKSGRIGKDATKVTIPGIKVVYYEPITKHNIPDVFWQFLNASGPLVTEGGNISYGQLSDPWFSLSGHPISDAYWSKVKIDQIVQDVMIQVYERRVLTYVPTNPLAQQVEMGNVGLHYYYWRYKGADRWNQSSKSIPIINEPLGPSPGMPKTGSKSENLLLGLLTFVTLVICCGIAIGHRKQAS